MNRTRLTISSALLTLLALPCARAADLPPFSRKEDVIYGRKHGMALTLDVLTPEKAKGIGVIFAVSGGWFSDRAAIRPNRLAELLARGYTVFAVVHGSQPRFTIPEVVEDMHRAVRFIRHNARDYGIDPERIGISGGSAGGHLSLMQGTAGRPGDPNAKDPVDRESSAVQAVACFYPPTDFLNYGQPGEVALGYGTLKDFRAPFEFNEFDPKLRRIVPIADQNRILEIGRSISPAYHASPGDAPALIIHGDADKLVPIQQAQVIVEKLQAAGVPARLVTKPGAGHGWSGVDKDVAAFADWFDEHLGKEKGEGKKL